MCVSTLRTSWLDDHVGGRTRGHATRQRRILDVHHVALAHQCRGEEERCDGGGHERQHCVDDAVELGLWNGRVGPAMR